MLGLVLTFDDGETFTQPAGFFYYAQPDVTQLFPPVGPTSGGTPLRLELMAGERYNVPALNLLAFDYSFGGDQYRPKCLFKNQAGLVRGTFFENDGQFVMAEATYDNDQLNREGTYSHWQDCHFADALSPSLLKHLLNEEGGAAE